MIIKDDIATVDIGGTTYEANIQLVPEAKVGDYVLIHTGLAIQIIDEEEANASLQTFKEFQELNLKMDNEEEESGQHLV
jgi:hydrogenase expression/formation protein HypC